MSGFKSHRRAEAHYRLFISLAVGLRCAPRPASAICIGDCDGNASVSVSELVRGVNIALGTQDAEACAALDDFGILGVDPAITSITATPVTVTAVANAD